MESHGISWETNKLLPFDPPRHIVEVFQQDMRQDGLRHLPQGA